MDGDREDSTVCSMLIIQEIEVQSTLESQLKMTLRGGIATVDCKGLNYLLFWILLPPKESETFLILAWNRSHLSFFEVSSMIPERC